MLALVDGRRTLEEILLAVDGALVDRAIASLQRLCAWGALVGVEAPTGPPTLELPDDLAATLGLVDHNTDIPIDDLADIEPQTDGEAALLAESVDLAAWEKRRIVAVARLMHRGDAHELLGVPPGVTPARLREAYRELAREFHPDRYYGRELGSFAALLDAIFRTATDAYRAMSRRNPT